MSEVKRYGMSGFGGGLIEIDDGPFVAAEDFDAQRLRSDTAEAELKRLDNLDTMQLIAELTKRNAAAEQRVAELVELIRDATDSAQSAGMLKAFINQINAALNQKS